MQIIPWIIIIVGIVGSSIVYSILNIEEYIEPISPLLTEATFFDPLCKDEQVFSIDYSTACMPHTQWSESMGSSTNIDDPKDVNNMHLKVLFLKIPLSELYESHPFHEIVVTDAQLILRTTDDNHNKKGTNNEFAIFNAMCQEISWNNDTPIEHLPCISKTKQIEGKLLDFSEYKKASELGTVKIDISEHVKAAIADDLTSFTELIQFYPKQFKNLPFTSEERFCLYQEVETITDMFQCIGENRIAVYSVEHPVDGLRPQIIIDYGNLTTILGTVVTSIISAIPSIASVATAILINKKSQNQERASQSKLSIKI